MRTLKTTLVKDCVTINCFAVIAAVHGPGWYGETMLKNEHIPQLLYDATFKEVVSLRNGQVTNNMERETAKAEIKNEERKKQKPVSLVIIIVSGDCC